MYQVKILDAAIHDLEKLDKPISRRIVQRLKWLSENLDNIRLEALSGDLSEFYKLRVGDYRILYQILASDQIIIVHQIGHRREIYRKR